MPISDGGYFTDGDDFTAKEEEFRERDRKAEMAPTIVAHETTNKMDNFRPKKGAVAWLKRTCARLGL